MPEIIEVDTAVVSARAGRNTRARDGSSTTSGSESIKRVSGNDLVIYTSEPEAQVPAEPVVLTPIDLTSETVEASAASRWFTEKVAEGIANRAGEKLFDNATGSGDGAAAAGKAEGSSARLEIQEELNCKFKIDLGFFKLEGGGKTKWKYVWGSESKTKSGGKSEGTGSVNPAPSKTPSADKPKETGKEDKPKETGKEDKPKETGKEEKPKETGKEDKPKETGKEDKPKDGDSGSGGKTEGDGDKKPKPGGKIYTDPNETLPPYATGAVEKFDDIMREYLTMSFSDSTAATAWLQQEANDAEIVIKVSGNGYEVADKLPDPVGVAATLRGMGVHDEDMIRVGVYETNLALRTLDRFVLDAQAAIQKQIAASQPQAQPSGSAAATTTSTSSATPGTTPGPLTPSAITFVPAFEQLVPSTFDIDKSVSRDVAKEMKGLKSTALDDNLKPRVLLSMDHTSLSGISVQAQLTTEITTTLSTEEHKPGVRIIPYTSRFAGVPGWQLEA